MTFRTAVVIIVALTSHSAFAQSPSVAAQLQTGFACLANGDGRCDLTGSYPTRGFGDSNAVDVWVPFNTSFGVPAPIRFAKLVVVVKPIGQLIGTDTLAIKGASGAARTVYSAFDTLPPNVWSTVEIPLTGDADVMAALAAGHLEGLVQDDTAVASMQLVLSV